MITFHLTEWVLLYLLYRIRVGAEGLCSVCFTLGGLVSFLSAIQHCRKEFLHATCIYKSEKTYNLQSTRLCYLLLLLRLQTSEHVLVCSYNSNSVALCTAVAADDSNNGV